MSTCKYTPTRICAERESIEQICQCFDGQESCERAQQLRSVFLPLMAGNSHRTNQKDGGYCGYSRLVGQSLRETLTGLVHAMDDKLPILEDRASLVLLATKAYFEKCANNDVRQLTARHRHQVYRVGVVSCTVNGDEDLIRQETFTTSNCTKTCCLEIMRLVRFAHNCKSPLVEAHKDQIWQIFSSVTNHQVNDRTLSLDEQRDEAVRRILVCLYHLHAFFWDETMCTSHILPIT